VGITTVAGIRGFRVVGAALLGLMMALDAAKLDGFLHPTEEMLGYVKKKP
jgi:hypothetical protein